MLGFRQLQPEDLQGSQRVWFTEDLVVDELYSRQMQWIKENAVQVADFDVNANARLFKMRIYVYDPAHTPQAGW